MFHAFVYSVWVKSTNIVGRKQDSMYEVLVATDLPMHMTQWLLSWNTNLP